jgi:hypothetical protein
MEKKEQWDAVLIINPGFIKKRYHIWQPLFTKKMILSIVKNPNNIYFSACGSDVPFFDYWNERNWKNKDIIDNGKDIFLSKSAINHFLYCSTFVNKVIPVMYQYAEAWRKSKYAFSYNVLETIPLPVNCSAFKINNTLDSKIVIFHGIIRPVDKGTKYIKDAMDRLQKEFPDVVECRAEGGLPLNEYLLLLNRTNVLIDQALADSVGMNGLYGLAMGKVVLGGNEPENQKEFNRNNSPVINITPNSEQIYQELKRIVLSPIIIADISNKSREYVEEVHDSIIIAQKYIEVFEKNNI